MNFFNRISPPVVLFCIILLMNFQMFLNLGLLGFGLKSVVVNALIFSISILFLPFKRVNLVDKSVYLILIFMVLMVVPSLVLYERVHPFSVIYGLNISFFPIFLYFYGRSLSLSGFDSFVNGIVGVHCIIYCIFLVLFFWQPDFYINYIRTNIIDSDETWVLFARLQGFYGSTAVGAIAVMMLYFTSFSTHSRYIKFFAYALFSFAVVLSFQRSSMAMALLFLIFWVVRSQAYKAPSFIFSGLLFFTALLVYVEPSRYQHYIYRIAEIPSLLLFEDRVSYGYLVYFLTNYPFGIGLGSASSSATADGFSSFVQVVDANHVKIIAEMGLLGLVLYMLPFLITLGRLFGRTSGKELGLVLILVSVQLQSLGTNLLDSYYVAHFYWLIIGILSSMWIDRKQHYREKT